MSSNASLSHYPYGLYTGLTDVQTLLPGTTTGIITASSLASGGSGYAVGDTGYIVGGGNNAYYRVTAVSSGVVTSYVISGGSGYATATGAATQISGNQPGSGSGLTITIGTVATGDFITTKQANNSSEPIGTYVITDTSADTTIALSPPRSGQGFQDGRIIRIISATAHAHVITGPTNIFNGNTHIATASGTLPNALTLEAYAGVWYVLANIGWTLS
jgi:hypothetical protein